MSVTIVYVTYEADLPWIYYSLQSVHIFARDISDILIYCHDACINTLSQLITTITCRYPIRILPVHYDYHGYIKQMVVKCMSYKDVECKYILFLDSDTILKRPFTIQNRIDEEGRICWHVLRRTQSNFKNEAFTTWEKAVAATTKTKMGSYYMWNGFPFLLTRASLDCAEQKFRELHGVSYDMYMITKCLGAGIKSTDRILHKFSTLATIFEEFEYMGWFCERYTTDYSWHTTEPDRTFLHQYWSHGGLTDTIRAEIEAILAIQS
jgi:hypothetical protein